MQAFPSSPLLGLQDAMNSLLVKYEIASFAKDMK